MKQKTETSLCESFMTLLKKHPFQKITIQMISEQSGVNRQTFYYHYDNIYDLMGQAFEYEFLRESHMVDGMAWDESMRLFLVWMKSNRIIIRNLLSNVDGCYLREAIYPIIKNCMSNGYKPNVIIKNAGDQIEEEFIQKFLTLGITQYILEWAENDFKEPEQEVIENIFLILNRVYG